MYAIMYSKLSYTQNESPNSTTNIHGPGGRRDIQATSSSPVLEDYALDYEPVAERHRERLVARRLPGEWLDRPAVRRIADLAAGVTRDRSGDIPDRRAAGADHRRRGAASNSG